VVAAVRRQREKERQHVESIWLRRLNKTYEHAAVAYEHAMNDEKGIDAAAKFLMVQARLCDTGLRADGVLAGGAETRVSVHVDQLVVLPAVQQPKVIDVTETKALPETS
jgi:hypothetical protein